MSLKLSQHIMFLCTNKIVQLNDLFIFCRYRNASTVSAKFEASWISSLIQLLAVFLCFFFQSNVNIACYIMSWFDVQWILKAVISCSWHSVLLYYLLIIFWPNGDTDFSRVNKGWMVPNIRIYNNWNRS